MTIDQPAGERESANTFSGKVRFQFHGEREGHGSRIPAYKRKRRKTIKVGCTVGHECEERMVGRRSRSREREREKNRKERGVKRRNER